MKCRLGSLMEHMDVRLMFYPRQAYLKVWLLHFITSVTKFLAVASLRLKHPSCPFFSQFCYKKREVSSKLLFHLLSWHER